MNFAQSFNATGAVLSSLLGRTFILTGVEYAPAQLAAMSSAQLAAFRASEASTVKGPYLAMAGIFVVLAIVFQFTHLPDVAEAGKESDAGVSLADAGSVLARKHLVRGVIAQFFYVGAQVGVASFVIRFVQHMHPGTLDTQAANYLKLHLLGFMIGRFAGSALMKKVQPAHMLAAFAVGCVASVVLVIFTTGAPALAGIVLLGFFHSIMFPTIFALSIRHLRETGASPFEVLRMAGLDS